MKGEPACAVRAHKVVHYREVFRKELHVGKAICRCPCGVSYANLILPELFLTGREETSNNGSVLVEKADWEGEKLRTSED